MPHISSGLWQAPLQQRLTVPEHARPSEPHWHASLTQVLLLPEHVTTGHAMTLPQLVVAVPPQRPRHALPS
jgi:hypothetical protein